MRNDSNNNSKLSNSAVSTNGVENFKHLDFCPTTAIEAVDDLYSVGGRDYLEELKDFLFDVQQHYAIQPDLTEEYRLDIQNNLYYLHHFLRDILKKK